MLVCHARSRLVNVLGAVQWTVHYRSGRGFRAIVVLECQAKFLEGLNGGNGEWLCRPLPYHLGTAPLLLRTAFRNRAGASLEHEPVGNEKSGAGDGI